jgi:hypothetical protein
MRVTFRATFQGRKGALAPIGFKFPNPPIENIEIFRRVDLWHAKSAATGHEIKQLVAEPSHGAMKDTVANAFEKQLSEWEMYDAATGKPLDVSRIEEDPKGNFTLRELTHVGKIGASQEEKGNYFLTACGETVHVRLLRSTRGQKPPDCPLCKVEWEKVAPGERLKA